MKRRGMMCHAFSIERLSSNFLLLKSSKQEPTLLLTLLMLHVSIGLHREGGEMSPFSPVQQCKSPVLHGALKSFFSSF